MKNSFAALNGYVPKCSVSSVKLCSYTGNCARYITYALLETFPISYWMRGAGRLAWIQPQEFGTGRNCTLNFTFTEIMGCIVAYSAKMGAGCALNTRDFVTMPSHFSIEYQVLSSRLCAFYTSLESVGGSV